jgi:glutamyl-tRNA synthetase
MATLDCSVDGVTSAAKSGYRGRLAPSPTGYLHVGHARTFWVAWQRAREAGGTLVMRMEDLDPDRSRKEYADAALEDLGWLGMRWDEGPDVGGPLGPYAQSERGALYRAAFEALRAGGWIYPCRCSRKDLAAALSAPHEGAEPDPLDDEPVYPGTCRVLIRAEMPGTHDELVGPNASGSGHKTLVGEAGANWRFRVPDGEAIEFVDGNLGPQRFVAGVDFGDFVVMRRDGVPGSPRTGPRPWGGGVPSYQLACVVDDAAMQITEVVRGADLLKSTARQMLLNRALGYVDPQWFHCGLVTDENGKRLAKRNDALSIRTLRERGWTAEQVLSSQAAPAE